MRFHFVLLVGTLSLAACEPDRPGGAADAGATAGSETGAALERETVPATAPEAAWTSEQAETQWDALIADLSRRGQTRVERVDAMRSVRKQIGALVEARIAAMSRLTELQQQIAGAEATRAASDERASRLESWRAADQQTRQELESIFGLAAKMQSDMTQLRFRSSGPASAELDQLSYGLQAERAHHAIPAVTQGNE